MKKQILMFIPYGIILIMRESIFRQVKTLRNLEISRTEIIYFCIDQTNLPYKGVRGKGTAIISEDINKNIPIVEKLMLKYTGSLDNNMAQFLLDSLKRGESVIIEIIPHFYATWDNSKGAI
jgi:hypothetical protein